jgi:hypothetical protein
MRKFSALDKHREKALLELLATGEMFSVQDVANMFEVSTRQASTIIQSFVKKHPTEIEFNAVHKKYERA